jgi:hypothetical protein
MGAMTPRMLLNEVQANVISGKVSPKDAAEDVSRFFALQSTKNYTDTGLKYLALPVLTDWTITTGSRGKNKVDLMNPTQVENYLTKQVASEKTNSQLGTTNPFMPWR